MPAYEQPVTLTAADYPVMTGAHRPNAGKLEYCHVINKHGEGQFWVGTASPELMPTIQGFLAPSAGPVGQLVAE